MNEKVILLTLLSEFILALFINSLVIVGIYIACNYEYDPMGDVDKESAMILWRVKYYGQLRFGKTIMEPICGCMTCMASVWGIVGFILFCYLKNFPFWLSAYGVIPYVFALAGINHIIYKKFIE